MDLVRSGDRFRVTRDVESHVGLVGYAPSHSFGTDCVVPAGTVIVALDQVPGASGFGCYPEDYDRMERVLVPHDERESFAYAGYYGLSFRVDEIGRLLEPLDPLNPRPPNRLPRVTGRPSPAQQAELARRQALHADIAALVHGRITSVTEGSWVRRNPSAEAGWESWDVWFDDPPGDPPRTPDATQPGSVLGVVGRIRDHET
jgi:hypothetical protein